MGKFDYFCCNFDWGRGGGGGGEDANLALFASLGQTLYTLLCPIHIDVCAILVFSTSHVANKFSFNLLAAQFEVVVPRPGVVKLRSVSTPQFYLAITGGYLIGYVSHIIPSPLFSQS